MNGDKRAGEIGFLGAWAGKEAHLERKSIETVGGRLVQNWPAAGSEPKEKVESDSKRWPLLHRNVFSLPLPLPLPVLGVKACTTMPSLITCITF